MGSWVTLDELKRAIEGMQKKIDDNQATAAAWRQEDSATANSITTTVDSLTTRLEALAALLTKLEPPPAPLEVPLDSQGADSSAPSPHMPPATATDGSAIPLLAKGILEANGVLHHDRDLVHKKQFIETQFLKTATSSSNGAGNPTDGMVPRYFKLDFPRFDGKENPLSWLSRCEQYFQAQKTEASFKIWLASFHLDGDAFHWYAHLERSRGVPSWEEFYALCNARFGPTVRSNPLGELRLLRQTGTVADYQSQFLALLSRADPIIDRQEQQMFTCSLSDDIRVDVELQGPRDLEHACNLAWAYETRVPCASSGRFSTARSFTAPRAPAGQPS
jgi:hypothetical protein